MEKMLSECLHTASRRGQTLMAPGPLKSTWAHSRTAFKAAWMVFGAAVGWPSLVASG